jgi:outer membrane protein
MRRFTIMTATAMLLLCISFVANTAQAELRIGTVDLQKVREDAPRFRNALDEIDDMVEDFERRRDKKSSELEELASEMQSYSSRSQAPSDNMRREFSDKSREFQQFMEETFGSEGIIENKSGELLAPLYTDLATAGKTVALASGIDLILDIEQINPLFVSEKLDLTDLVLAEFVKMR